MIGKGFRIAAFPEAIDVTCPECRYGMVTIRNGLLANPSELFVCLKCKAVYQLSLVALPDEGITDKAGLLKEARKAARR